MQSYYVLIQSYTHWRRRLAKLEDEEIRDFSWPPGGGRLALIRALGAKARLMCKNIDRFLSWNRHPEFVRDMTAMRGCLEHFAVFFLAVGRILRGRSSQLPPGLPPPRDFRLSFVSEVDGLLWGDEWSSNAFLLYYLGSGNDKQWPILRSMAASTEGYRRRLWSDPCWV